MHRIHYNGVYLVPRVLINQNYFYYTIALEFCSFTFLACCRKLLVFPYYILKNVTLLKQNIS